MDRSADRRHHRTEGEPVSARHLASVPAPSLDLPGPSPELVPETATALVSAQSLTSGRILDADPAMATLLGATVAELRGRDLSAHLRRDDPDDAGELSDVLAGRRARAVGLRQLLTAQGQVVECHFSAALARPRADEGPAVVFSVTPLGAELRRAREDARITGDALDVAPSGIAIFDRWGRCVRANLAWATIGGVSGEAGADHVLLGTVEEPEAVRAAIDAALGGARQELLVRSATPDGAPLVVRTVLVPRGARDGAGGGFVAFAHDVEQPGVEAREPGDDDIVGPGVVARTLGVSHSTVRRWVEDGQIRATRTPGGHRRITRAELRRVARTLGRPGRLKDPPLPEQPLPVLAGILHERGARLVDAAARGTYEPGAPGWFVEEAAARVLSTWCRGAARAAATGRSHDFLIATRSMFVAARDVAGLEECLVFSDRLVLLLIHQLQQAPSGADEARDASILLATVRRSLTALEDERG